VKCLAAPKNRYTKAILIATLMKQNFSVFCKRNIHPPFTIQRIKCSHLHSEYRNDGKEGRE